MSPDKNVEAVRTKLLERSQFGLAKYGVTTERTDTDLVGWLNHLQQELMDAAVYVQRSMVEVDTKAQIAELESLRAWKAEIEKQEPVGYKMTQEELMCTDGRTPVLWFGHLPYGTHLFAAPVVSPDVDALKANPADNYFELACHEYRQKIQSLQVENELLKQVEANLCDLHNIALDEITEIKSHNKLITDMYVKYSDESRLLKAELEAARKDAESWRSYKKRKDEVIAAGMGRNILRDPVIEQAKGAV